MTQQTVHPRYVFDIKSSNLSLVALVLRSTDLTLLSRDFDLRFGAMPNFFDQEGVVIDLSQACSTRGGCGSGNLETALEFSVLIDLLRSHQLRPVAIRGGNEQQIAAALANGLVHTAREPERSLPTKKPEPAESRERVVGGVPADPVVVERQVRCGQQIYAKGRDLVILGMVNPGAEVVADGNIHIYAPLRGCAIAGASGNQAARIFTLAMEPEIVSIAGVYCTGDAPLPQSMVGKAARISLSISAAGERLSMEEIFG